MALERTAFPFHCLPIIRSADALDHAIVLWDLAGGGLAWPGGRLVGALPAQILAERIVAIEIFAAARQPQSPIVFAFGREPLKSCLATRGGTLFSQISHGRMKLSAAEIPTRNSGGRSCTESLIHPFSTASLPPDPSLPDADPGSGRVQCGGRECKFLGAG